LEVVAAVGLAEGPVEGVVMEPGATREEGAALVAPPASVVRLGSSRSFPYRDDIWSM